MSLSLTGYGMDGTTDRPVEISKMDYVKAIGGKVAWLVGASLLVLAATGGLAAFLATPVGHAMIIAIAVAVTIFAVLAAADHSVREKAGDTNEQKMEARIQKLSKDLDEERNVPRAKTWAQTLSALNPMARKRVIY